MATTITTHCKMGIVDSSGNVNVLYPQTTGADVSITPNSVVSATTVQNLVDSLKASAFISNFLGIDDTSTTSTTKTYSASKIAALNSDIISAQSSMNTAIAELQSSKASNDALSIESASRANADTILSTRIDNIANIPSGSTSGDAEVIDIRLGHDNRLYSTAGSAVRTQFENISKMSYILNNNVRSTNGYIRYDNGELNTNNGGTYYYTDMIAVSPYDVIEFNQLSTSSNMYCIAAYENLSDTACLPNASYRGNTSRRSYLVPATGVNFIRICYNDVDCPTAKIKRRYNDLFNRLSYSYTSSNLPFIFNQGYISSSGTIVDVPNLTNYNSTYYYSDPIQVEEGDIFVYGHFTAYSSTLMIAAYENADDATAVIDKSVVGTTVKYTRTYRVPFGINYIRLCVRYDENTDGIIFYKGISHIIRGAENSNIPIMNLGYIATNGTASVGTGLIMYRYSDFISVKEGDIYKYENLSGSENSTVIAAYSDSNENSFIQSKSIVGTTNNTRMNGIYVVPAGVKYLRYCMRVTYKYTSFAKFYKIGGDVKELSILFVGNSLTEDAIAYLPYMLKTYSPEISFHIYMFYNGGKTLGQQYDEYFTQNNPCSRFNVAENTAAWTISRDSVTMNDILTTYHFDIVCMQEYFNYKESYTDVTDWNNCENYITSHYTGGNCLKFVSLIHAPKRNVLDQVYSLTELGNKMIIRDTSAEDLLPVGTALYYATNTTLNNLGDKGGLSNDQTHAQEGLGPLIETYVLMIWIYNMFGISKSIYNCPMIMTQAIYNTLNVPGPNLGTGIIPGTVAENLLGQKMAIKAWKHSRALLNDAFDDITY